MEPIVFLIAFPACIALLLLFVKAEAARKPIVYVSAALIAAASIYVAVSGFGKPWTPFAYENALVDGATMVVSIAIAATIIAYAVKYKNVLAGALAVIQVVGSMVFEIGYAHGCTVENALYFDSLTLIMTLIIGVVGSGICVYALGYMEDFQAHEPEESKDRRPVFSLSCSCSSPP